MFAEMRWSFGLTRCEMGRNLGLQLAEGLQGTAVVLSVVVLYLVSEDSSCKGRLDDEGSHYSEMLDVNLRSWGRRL